MLVREDRRLFLLSSLGYFGIKPQKGALTRAILPAKIEGSSSDASNSPG